MSKGRTAFSIWLRDHGHELKTKELSEELLEDLWLAYREGGPLSQEILVRDQEQRRVFKRALWDIKRAEEYALRMGAGHSSSNYSVVCKALDLQMKTREELVK